MWRRYGRRLIIVKDRMKSTYSKGICYFYKMLLNTLLTKYGWIITNVPQILHSDPFWKSWLNNLSENDILNLKMNISGMKYSRDAIVDEFDNYDLDSDEFDCFCKIHCRLVELLLRLD